MKSATILYTLLLTAALAGCTEQSQQGEHKVAGENDVSPENSNATSRQKKAKQPEELITPQNTEASGYYKVEPINVNQNDMYEEQSAPSRPVAELQIHQGNFFSYALPPGWNIGEDGQFAITLVAPDRKALTVMVGNAGLLPNHPPSQFVYEKMMALRPEALQFGQPASAQPISGFQEAYRFPVSYQVQGENCVGEVTCHISNYYGGRVMAMTGAFSTAAQWQNYSGWLPQVSRQMSAINGAAFGARGIMQQNLQNSMAFGEAARQYREWSQKNWQQVTDDRNRSADNRNYQFREALGGVQTYNNPYNTQVPVELSNQYSYYWVNPAGQYVGTNDPNVDPNHGSNTEWKRLQRKENY